MRLLDAGGYLCVHLWRFSSPLPKFIFVLTVAWVALCGVVAYVAAPLVGRLGQHWMGPRLDFHERSTRAIEIVDAASFNVGVLNPLLEPTYVPGSRAISIPSGSLEYPDHKTLPVAVVPPHFWNCLRYQEDRFLGTWRNPFGIDLMSLMGMPITGRGASTLAMQFARTYWKIAPARSESVWMALRRKAAEQILGPIIHYRLVNHPDPHRYAKWAADHLPMLQRDGSDDLYGLGFAARTVFGITPEEMATDESPASIARQYILAAAVNQPIPVLHGSTNRQIETRRNIWRRAAGVRAQECRRVLLAGDSKLQDAVRGILAELEKRPPSGSDVKYGVNPRLRASRLALSLQLGAQREMARTLGRDWRAQVGSLHLSIDVLANHALGERLRTQLRELDRNLRDRYLGDWVLATDRSAIEPAIATRTPDVIIAATRLDGGLTAYFDLAERSAYYDSSGGALGAPVGRPVASVGKILVAMTLGAAGERSSARFVSYRGCRWPCPETDVRGPCVGNAESVFARSQNAPILSRVTSLRLGERLRATAERLGYALPRDGTPIATAAVCGYLRASPQVVLRSALVALAALMGRYDDPIGLPGLVSDFRPAPGMPAREVRSRSSAGFAPVSARQLGLATPESVRFVESVLSAPLCGVRTGDHGAVHVPGTLARLSDWCPLQRPGLQHHIAKTGTHESSGGVSDVWTVGALQFRSGAEYAYVVLIGTGNPSDPWVRRVNAGQITAPLVRILLEDLENRQFRSRI